MHRQPLTAALPMRRIPFHGFCLGTLSEHLSERASDEHGYYSSSTGYSKKSPKSRLIGPQQFHSSSANGRARSAVSCGVRVMPHSPSIVPEDSNRDIYLVLDHFGVLGRVWRETDETDANRTKLIQDLLDGHYSSPVRIVAFNTAEGWSRDASKDIAAELAQACADGAKMPRSIAEFIAIHNRPSRAR
jgi:hypothetical protein